MYKYQVLYKINTVKVVSFICLAFITVNIVILLITTFK